jgi:hypothetical protein
MAWTTLTLPTGFICNAAINNGDENMSSNAAGEMQALELAGVASEI